VLIKSTTACAVLLLIACHPSARAIAAREIEAAREDSASGQVAVLKSDCLSCHHQTERLVAPSFQQIAGKYPVTKANIELLSLKIQKGGSGNWGTLPMTPHPGLSTIAAGSMVKYILLTKNK
jgi:cytochrome c